MAAELRLEWKILRRRQWWIRGRDTLQQQLSAAGVQTTINYPIPLHLQPAYSDLGYKMGDFPHAEKLAREQLSLPVYAELTVPQIEQVCAVITKTLTL